MWPYGGGIANAIPRVSHSFLPDLCFFGPILGIRPSNLWALVLHGGGLKSARRPAGTFFFCPKVKGVGSPCALRPIRQRKKFPLHPTFSVGFGLSEASEWHSQPHLRASICTAGFAPHPNTQISTFRFEKLVSHPYN